MAFGHGFNYWEFISKCLDFFFPCKQEILHSINGSMHVSLQDKTKFSLLGQYGACINYGQNGVEEDVMRKTSTHGVDGVCKCYGQWSCGCLKFDGFLGQCRQASMESNYWIELAYDSLRLQARGIHWVPKLHHLHWKKEIVSQCDVHVRNSDCFYCLSFELYLSMVINPWLFV